MDATAIKEIKLSQDITAANSTISDEIDKQIIALPSDFAVHNLEKYFENRTRFRGKLETKSIAAFISYANNKAIEGAATFINADTMKAMLIVNLGDNDAPGHADHTALLALEKTAPFKALLEIANQRKTQKEIAEFIEDWRNHLTASRAEDETGTFPAVSIVKALHAVRKISIEAIAKSDSEVKTFGATTTSMESIDVRSDEMPPDFFYFNCEPYLGLPTRTFTLRLSVITDRTPALVLRIVKYEEHTEQMAEEFQLTIESDLQDVEPKIATYIGNFTP